MKFILALCLFLSVPVAFAKGECKEDRQKLCKDVEKGKGRIKRCLMSKWSEVSDGCKSKHQEKYDKWSKREAACGADIKTHCADVDAGKGAIRKCLKEKKESLSASCQTFMKEKKAHFKEKMKSCTADIEQFCKDVKKGKGRTWKCLKENKDSLSETCKSQWPSLNRKNKKASQ